MMIYGLDEVFDELERYCYSIAILTVTDRDKRALEIDLHWEHGRIEYGYEVGVKAFLGARLISAAASGGAGMILRSFLAERDSASGLPVKELRGSGCSLRGNRLALEPLSVQELRWACETDAKTGAPLEPEPAVVYRGPEDEKAGG